MTDVFCCCVTVGYESDCGTSSLISSPITSLDQVNGAIVLVCLLECCNACQCFALQAILSGGQNDTPLDLVRWKAYMVRLREMQEERNLDSFRI